MLNNARSSELQQRLQAEALIELQEGILVRQWKQIAAGAEDLQPLWKNIIYLNAVTILVGEPGIGKTTLEYALLKEITHGRPFLGIHPTTEILSLICDFESSDSLIKQRYLKMTDGEQEYPNIKIVNTTNYDFYNLIPALGQCRTEYPFNLLIIDNMLTAFDYLDENDNAEARGMIKTLQGLSREWNCAMVICHHPSKANLGGTRKGSGAYAWARCSDIYLCLNHVQGEDDMIEIETSKNRCSEDWDAIYCKKIGNGEFEQCDPPLGMLFSNQKPIDRTCRMIIDLDRACTRAELLELASKDIGVKPSTVDRAIKRLMSEKLLMGDGYNGYITQKAIDKLKNPLPSSITFIE